MRNFIRIVVILFPVFSFAERGSSKGGVFLEPGAYVTQIGERLDAASGKEGTVSTLSGFVRLRTSASLGKNWFFDPALGTMLPWRSGVDGSVKTFMTHLNLDLAKQWRWFKVRMGPGIFWQWMRSSEEAVSLNNGTGTSTFYTPGRSESVFLVTANAGLSFRLSPRIFLNTDVYVLQVFSSARRGFNGTITLGWRL